MTALPRFIGVPLTVEPAKMASLPLLWSKKAQDLVPHGRL